MSKASMQSPWQQTLSDAGFVQRRRWFLREEANIVQCIVVERPSQLIYPTYCILPLYLPCPVRHFTYGRRISEVTGYRNAADINTLALANALERSIFPFFEHTRTPALLFQYLQNEAGAQHFFFCPPVELAKLTAYTALYLYDLPHFYEALEKTEHLLDGTSCYTERSKADLRLELQRLREVAAHGSAAIQCFFAETIAAGRGVILR